MIVTKSLYFSGGFGFQLKRFVRKSYFAFWDLFPPVEERGNFLLHFISTFSLSAQTVLDGLMAYATNTYQK